MIHVFITISTSNDSNQKVATLSPQTSCLDGTKDQKTLTLLHPCPRFYALASYLICPTKNDYVIFFCGTSKYFTCHFNSEQPLKDLLLVEFSSASCERNLNSSGPQRTLWDFRSRFPRLKFLSNTSNPNPLKIKIICSSLMRSLH